MRKLVFFLLLAFVGLVPVSSQVYFAEKIDEDLLKGRVKQVEEFMARFNYEEDWLGQRVENPADSLMRQKYLHTLFDYFRFRQDDGRLTALAEQFIQDVMRNDYRIHYSDTTWMALVRCKASVNGRSYGLELRLRPQQMAPHEYHWIIAEADGPLFAPPARSAVRPSISPMEHEIGFTGLLSLPAKREMDVSLLFPSGFEPDNLSMLAFLLKSGMLTFTAIDDVSFLFLSVPGYAFLIERVERRDSYNTGWLITSLSKL